ncbi:hypothetical protein BJV78DRAFT_1281860 [Lactifluus subvellereus]|nr:hypothetical protein BJV78DRAFT_1281860 [Lactifluus subvellereus]
MNKPTHDSKGKKRAAPEALSEELSVSPSLGPSKRPRQATTPYALRSRSDAAQPSVPEIPKEMRQSTAAKGMAASAKSKAMAAPSTSPMAAPSASPMIAPSTSTTRAFCFLVDPNSQFLYKGQPTVVKVPPGIDVHDLKEKIIEVTKIDVPALRLEVWDGNFLKKREPSGREEIPEGKELEERLHDFGFSVETRLRTTSLVELSNGDIVIARLLPKFDVDVDVSGASRPEGDGSWRKKSRCDEIVAKFAALPAPSAAAQPKNFGSYLLGPEQTPQPSKVYFLCNRPINYETIPLVLMHPVFGTFCHQIRTLQPTAGDSDSARILAHEMSGVYKYESGRRERFRSWFTRTYQCFMETKVGPPTSGTAPQKLPESDGHVLVSNFVTLISECKFEASSTSSDARYQAMMYYVKLFAASKVSQEHLSHSCLPAILIVCEGACLQVFGIIMHPDGTPQAEPFLSLLLNCDWRNRGERDSITRFIGALRNCLKSLEKYYDGLAQVDVPPASDTVTVRGAERRAPYLCQYTSLNKEPVEFKYLELLIGGRMVFKAEELHTGRRVIVKFAQRYGKEAHQILARSGAAPELLGVDELADEWKMITIELLPSDKWVLLEDLSREERQQYQDKVREAVLRLHAGDQVHGDVRACNIFVPKSGNGDDIQLKFIDLTKRALQETRNILPTGTRRV